MDAKTIAVAGVALLLGAFFGYSATLPSAGDSAPSRESSVELSSLVGAWRGTGEGRVENVSENSITIANEGRKLTAEIGETTEVRKSIISLKTNDLQEEVTGLEASDIGRGNNAAVAVVSNANGELVAERITIIELR